MPYGQRLLFGLVLLVCAVMPASAQSRTDADALIDQALDTSQRLLVTANWDTRSYRVRLSVLSGRCEQAIALIRNDNSFTARHVQDGMLAAVRLRDHACATQLARLAYSRCSDPGWSSAGQMAFGIVAGAVLRLAGEEAEGSSLIRETEENFSELQPNSGPDMALQVLWEHRFRALSLYDGGSLFAPALDEYVRQLALGDFRQIETATANGFLVYLAREGRRNDAERVMRAISGTINDYASLQIMAVHYQPNLSCLRRGHSGASRDDLFRALQAENDMVRLSQISEVVEAAAFDKFCAS